jgi:hypothetical protein
MLAIPRGVQRCRKRPTCPVAMEKDITAFFEQQDMYSAFVNPVLHPQKSVTTFISTIQGNNVAYIQFANRCHRSDLHSGKIL